MSPPETRPDAGATDWTEYYKFVPLPARLTRRYTSTVLLRVLRTYTKLGSGRPATIVELGGANSCFLEAILRELRPAEYHIVDTNEYGLSLLKERLPANAPVRLHHTSALELPAWLKADVVFSVGLIEHFDASETAQLVRAHFRCLLPGGCAILSFPTPTWLYRLARTLAESAGLWRFPDERPLAREEVLGALASLGEVLHEEILWPIVFTQRLIVARKFIRDER